jgi:hypothetical protein
MSDKRISTDCDESQFDEEIQVPEESIVTKH